MIRSLILFPSCNYLSLRFVEGAPTRYQLPRSYRRPATTSEAYTERWKT
ncbi:hypothetical protein Goarm_009860 [Gossypium armourianum]|uniref:Uncharacterized protein n=1 Tax=Gossypium armourianum TaxID=34283 RepID=A0A7J9JU42_9ROSI|nr:hypothetical protein [Gossypium armourianum]